MNSPEKNEMNYNTSLNQKAALIIDDSDMNRHILNKYLMECGYQVHAAKDGVEGIARFKALKPTITFLDIVMPKKSGLDVLKDIRFFDKESIVIMVSSYITKQNIQEAKQTGANWFLMKPFTKEKLVEIIKKFESSPELKRG